MPNLTPITPCSVGLCTGQGNNAYGHGAHSVRFSVERHAEHGCDGVAQGLPPVTEVSTSVTQTSSVLAYSRPLPSPTVHSRSQRRVSFAPVSRDTTTGSMDMEATSMYGGIWLPFGVSSQEGNYAPVSTHDTAKFPCSYQTTPQAREVPQQSMSRVNLRDFRVHCDVVMLSFMALMLASISHHRVTLLISWAGTKVITGQVLERGRMMWIFQGKHVLVVFLQVMAWQAIWPIIPMWMFERCQPGIHMMMLLLLEVEVVSVMV